MIKVLELINIGLFLLFRNMVNMVTKELTLRTVSVLMILLNYWVILIYSEGERNDPFIKASQNSSHLQLKELLFQKPLL